MAELILPQYLAGAFTLLQINSGPAFNHCSGIVAMVDYSKGTARICIPADPNLTDYRCLRIGAWHHDCVEEYFGVKAWICVCKKHGDNGIGPNGKSPFFLQTETSVLHHKKTGRWWCPACVVNCG